MEILDGNCCKNEGNILCLMCNYIVPFGKVPAASPPDDFVSTGEVILEDTSAESREMFIMRMADVLKYVTLEFAVQV
jgi:hypothetical protein